MLRAGDLRFVRKDSRSVYCYEHEYQRDAPSKTDRHVVYRYGPFIIIERVNQKMWRVLIPNGMMFAYEGDITRESELLEVFP